jgi:uncharacterized protein (TIGR02118 family)
VHRLTIWYAVPEDPAAFDEEYLTAHVPLVLPAPGLRAFTWSRPRPLGGPQTVHLVAELDFDDAEALQSALRSPEMTEAAEHAAGLGTAMTMFSGEVVSATDPR